MYLGKPENVKAVQALEKACALDSPNGCGMLGLVYMQGKAVAKDEVKGKSSLTKACGLGFQPACQLIK